MARLRQPARTRRGRPLYLADGRATPQLGQLGQSGMIVVTGGLGKRLRDLEYLSDLAGLRGYYVYDRMRRSDTHIAGLMAAMDLPLVDATWNVIPAEGDAPDSPACKAVREALFTRLGHDTSPWPQMVQNFLLYPAYGYAAFEIIWKVEDGKFWFDRFAWCPPTTIRDIHIEAGRVSKLEQWLVDDTTIRRNGTTSVFVPQEKLLWFVNNKEGDNWRGVSVLRPMHKDWFAKEKAQIMFLILAERMGGVLMIKTPKNATAADKAAADELGHNFRIGDSVYVRTPEGWEVELGGIPLQLSELREYIKDCNEALSSGVLAQYLDLGKTDTGSRSLGATLSEAFLNTVQARGKYIASVFNAEGGPIDQFIAYNFGEGARERRPQLAVGRVSRMNLAATTDALQKLAACGYPLSGDMWDFIAEEAEFPKPDAELAKKLLEQKLNPPQPTLAAPGGSRGAPPPGRKPEEARRETRAAEDEAQAGLALAAGSLGRKFWRAPTGPELYMELDDIRALLDGGKEELRRRTESARTAQVAKLAEKARAAVQAGSAAQAADIAKQSAPGEERIAAVIKAVLAEWVTAGSNQVRRELSRQRNGDPVLRTIFRARDRTRPEMRMADPPTADPDEVARMVDAMARSLAASISDAARQGAAQAALRALAAYAYLRAIGNQTQAASDGAALRAGICVSRFVNMGRAIAASEEASQIVGAVYSALMDNNTCAVCEDADGQVTHDLALAESWTPNIQCEGVEKGNECRCLSIYVYDEAVLDAVPAELASEPPVAAAEAAGRRVRRSTRYITDERGAIIGSETVEECD